MSSDDVKTPAEIYAAFREAEAEFKPHKKAMNQVMADAIDTIQNFYRTHDYFSSPKFDWVRTSDHYFDYHHEGKFYFHTYDVTERYGSDDTFLTMEDIEDIEAMLEADRVAYHKIQEDKAQNRKEVRRKELEAELKSLSEDS